MDQIENSAETWTALHICDASFGGSLSHSFGLESALNNGLVKKVSESEDSLEKYILMMIETACSYSLPFVHMAFNAADSGVQSGTVGASALSVEKLFHISLANDVSRRASLNQGNCFLRMVVETYGEKHPLLYSLSEAARKSMKQYQGGKAIESNEEYFRGHHTIVFGLICRLLGVSLPMTFRMYLRILVRDLLSAAARLNIVGPLEGGRIQAALASVLECSVQSMLRRMVTITMVDGSQGLQPLEPFQTSPYLDLLQSRHDLLYSRLFNS